MGVDVATTSRNGLSVGGVKDGTWRTKERNASRRAATFIWAIVRKRQLNLGSTSFLYSSDFAIVNLAKQAIQFNILSTNKGENTYTH